MSLLVTRNWTLAISYSKFSQETRFQFCVGVFHLQSLSIAQHHDNWKKKKQKRRSKTPNIRWKTHEHHYQPDLPNQVLTRWAAELDCHLKGSVWLSLIYSLFKVSALPSSIFIQSSALHLLKLKLQAIKDLKALFHHPEVIAVSHGMKHNTICAPSPTWRAVLISHTQLWALQKQHIQHFCTCTLGQI